MVDAPGVLRAAPGPGYVLDERSGFLYFTATEKDPRERHLYRVRLDGTGRTRLTREDGTHRTRRRPPTGGSTRTPGRTRARPPKLWVASQDGDEAATPSRRTPTRRSSASSAARSSAWR